MSSSGLPPLPNLPTIVTKAGLQPVTPATLRNVLLTSVAAVNPGYTATLPGSLIEDISSTDVGAMVIIDSARVDLVNSVTPWGANEALLNELGQVYGVPQGAATNTSVFVAFSGTVGFVIAKGFTVSDGTHQYVVQDGGVVGSDGTSAQLFCVATVTGSWGVPSNTVVNLVTSVPNGITLTVTNPEAGLAGQAAETTASYRARVLQAGLAASQGMSRYMKTLLGNVDGVQPRLVSVRQQEGGGWEVLVGGGDPFEVGYAIYASLFDVSTLVGSTINVLGVTQANPGVVTTDLNHGYATGQAVAITGSNPSNYNGSYVATVISPTTFSIGVDTSGFPAYVDDAVITPNFRNIVANLIDYPDVYRIPFVNPPQQTVTMTVTWNSTAPNAVPPQAVAQLGGPAVANYVNSVPVGQPMNLYELQATFQEAVSALIPPALLTRMVFAVAINGVGVSPEVGTGIIAGDPESYFTASVAGIVVVQG